MIPTILKGCTSQQIALALPADFDPAGWKLHVSFNGVMRSFDNLAAGGMINLQFSADETAAFPVGTERVLFVLSNSEGHVAELPWAKIKVTDSRDEYAAAINSSTLQVEVKDALIGVAALPPRWTEDDMRTKINEIIARLGGAVAAFVLALSASAASVNLQTAPKGAIYNDEQVVTNATFDASGLATPQDIATATNAALQAAKEYADGAISAAGAVTPEAVTNIVNDIAPTPGDYENVSNKAVNAVQEVVINDVTNNAFKIAVKGIPTSTWYTNATTDDAARVKIGTLTVFQGKSAEIKVAGADEYIEWPVTGNQPANYDLYAPGETDPTVPSWAKAANPPSETDPTVPAWAKSQNPPVMSLEPATNYTDTAVSNVVAIVETWENFLDGSNVIFSVTNYISGTYNIDDAKLKIRELKNGGYEEVYNSRSEIVAHLDDFKTATNRIMGAVNDAMTSKADKAWGTLTSAGGIAPSNTVYMTAPNTVFAGGLEYERVAVGEGAICVLTTKGAPVWTQGDEGTFKFQDDGGTNFFGFAKSDSYVIGANTDGISVNNQLVTLTYNITMSGLPCIWYKADLTDGLPWEQLNYPDGSAVNGASHVVSWEQSPPAGRELCYINVGSAPAGFFKATIEVAGEVKFMTNMRADLQGGIVCTNTATGVLGVIRPTFNGSTVTWTWSAQ